MSDLQLTPYQQDCLGQLSTSAFRIACALERLVEIAECAASGWLNACPPRGEYSPDMNAKRRGPSDPEPPSAPAVCSHPSRDEAGICHTCGTTPP